MIKPLPLIATIFSIFALLPDILKRKKYSDYSLSVTVFTLISVSVWLLHYYQIKDWFSAVEVLIVFALNLQILYGILSTPKTEERSVFRQTSDGVHGYTFEECTAQE